MSEIDKTFKHLSETILTKGRLYENQNRGVKRQQITSYTFRHSFKDGFPALALKELKFDSVVAELIWFLNGQTHIKDLHRRGTSVWDNDAWTYYCTFFSNNDIMSDDIRPFYRDNSNGTYSMFTFQEFKEKVRSLDWDELPYSATYNYTLGDCGKNYSHQWRNYNGDLDQIKELIDGMKKDIMSSRLIVNAWNPSELKQTALPPCHDKFQVIGVPLNLQERIDLLLESVPNISDSEILHYISLYNADKNHHFVDYQVTKLTEFLDYKSVPAFGFELHWNQRSVDTFLGLPFNIASYGLLALVLEIITGYPALAIEGALKCVHFYGNQFEGAEELVKRDADKHKNCDAFIKINRELIKDLREGDFSQLTVEHFSLIGYTFEEAIKVEMLAPKVESSNGQS